MNRLLPAGALLGLVLLPITTQAALPGVVTNSLGMKLAPIAAGEFQMGAEKTIRDAGADERPVHAVRLTRPFHIGVHEVTQEQFLKVMKSSPSFFANDGHGKGLVKGLDTSVFPADQVRFIDAVEFCRKLSASAEEKKAGRFYRLPTEAEWEYACRGGSVTAFHFGDSLSAKQANFNGKYPYRSRTGEFRARTARVGSFAANAYGLYDMHGNVWEWCLDWYHVDAYRKPRATDPLGPATGTSRVIRGGGWYSDARDCRSSFRYAEHPLGTYYVMGFRVVMTPSADVPAALRRFWDGIDTSAGPSKPQAAGSATILPTREQLVSVGGESWPRWRGLHGNGTWNGPRFPARWPVAGLKSLWRKPIGGGYSGIAASAGRLYTLEKLKKPADTATDTAADTEQIVCLDAASGKRLWTYRYTVAYKGVSYPNGPRSTPSVVGNRVYTLGAVGHLFCLDATSGKVIWSRDLVTQHKSTVPLWGFSASPIVVDGLLIVHAGGTPNGCFIGFDPETGKQKWSSLGDPLGYATPLVIEQSGRKQLVCWTPSHVRGLNPRTGSVAWSHEYKVHNGVSISMPIYHRGIVLVSNYWEGVQALQLTSDLSQAKLAWEDRRNLRSLMSQPLCRGEHGYLLDKRHGLTCFELATGKKVWDDGNRMTPKGRNPQATMVWLGSSDRAVVLNSDGELLLVRLAPEGYQEISRSRVIGPTWAHPAYAWGCVYIRNDDTIACIEVVPAAR